MEKESHRLCISLEKKFCDIREVILRLDRNKHYQQHEHTCICKYIHENTPCSPENAWTLPTVNLSHLPVVTCYEVNYDLSGAETIFHCKSSLHLDLN